MRRPQGAYQQQRKYIDHVTMLTAISEKLSLVETCLSVTQSPVWEIRKAAGEFWIRERVELHSLPITPRSSGLHEPCKLQFEVQ